MSYRKQEMIPSMSDCDHGDCDCGDGCCPELGAFDRRRFVQMTSASIALAAWQSGGAIAGPFEAKDTIDHFVPKDKKLSEDWVRSLFAKGKSTWHSGTNLETIGMPVGGICAGQVYLTGDGRLVYWDIYNSNINSGIGATNYQINRKPTDRVIKGVSDYVPSPEVSQGNAIQVEYEGRTEMRTLDAKGFPGVRFCGEYPIGLVEYVDQNFPVEVTLEAFSPFIPGEASDSALPATVLNYTVKNTGSSNATVTLAGWLENATVFSEQEQYLGRAARRNFVVREPDMTTVISEVESVASKPLQSRPPLVFADFESENYGDWRIEGEAFGKGPTRGALLKKARAKGYQGEGLANSLLDGVGQHRGKLISPSFVIERPWISLLVGGGAQPTATCVNLLVDNKIVRSARGNNREEMLSHNWSVEEFSGKQARIEIVDSWSKRWAFISVDQIEFCDEPIASSSTSLELSAGFGSMALAVLGDENVFAKASLPEGSENEVLFDTEQTASQESSKKGLNETLRGAVGKLVELAPGQEATITFLVSWHMPNNYFRGELVGNHYAGRFDSAADVARYLVKNFDRLQRETRLWHATYYDSTLPHWLLDRIGATVCNLATNTCQWWGNGRFWAWEGAGCCHGTCGHVWNYEHALARLFPELERSVRTMQDFEPEVGFDSESGAIVFRGEYWTNWAGDSQGGYVLKAYREHQCSTDDAFLARYWNRIRKATQFLIDQDGNSDGLIEGAQHQTYDEDYYGANTLVGSLYLGALRAAEEMALEVGDNSFAKRCRAIFEAGKKNSVDRLFNGEYYIQDVDLTQHPNWQYADGCLADQMFGQTWAHQVGLGYLYPRETVVKSLSSIWKYCWAPDIGPQNEPHRPQRWYAYPGEAGLFICTWPKSKHLGNTSTRYRNEIWTGIEYQVASHLAWEGMLTESLAICRAVHERYHPAKRNPYNEIECGDHYARALASWGMLTSLAGFEYHGPKGHIGFAPRLQPEDYRTVFTVAEGWGTYRQKQTGDSQTAEIAVKYGQVKLNSIALALVGPLQDKKIRSIRINGEQTDQFEREEQRVTLKLAESLSLGAGETLKITLSASPEGALG